MQKNLRFPRIRLTGHCYVVGEFRLNGCEYWIINLNGKQDHTEPNRVTPHHLDSAVEIRRFEVDGQLCAIVQAEPSTTGMNHNFADILTERELQITTLVARGCLNKQIADKLDISEWTVSTHLRRIFAKLGVNTRAAMVHRCAELIGQPRI